MATTNKSTGGPTILKSLIAASATAIGAYLAYRFYSIPRSVRPGINAPFADETKQADEFVDRFETESREIFNKMQTVVDILQIPAGSHVADIGAGTGLFMKSLAEVVGPLGRVYSLEPYPKFIEHLTQRRAKLAPELANRIAIQSNNDFSLGSGIPDSSLDYAILIDAYHHIEYPSTFIKSVYKSLKPSGRLVILDFERIPGVSSEWVLGHVRAGREVVTKEIESCGFIVEKDLKDAVGLRENYLTVFKKEQW